MGRVKLRWDLVPTRTVLAAIIVACPVLVWLAMNLRLGIMLIVLIAATVAIYVGLFHPLWLYWALAVLLALVPFARIPGVNLPMWLLLSGGAIFAAILYPRPETRFHRLEIAVFVYVIVSGVSFLVTSLSTAGALQYVRWSIPTLVMVALLRLSKEDLEKFGRIFVWAATANAIWGILLVTVDQGQKSLKILNPFGYALAQHEEILKLGVQNLNQFAYDPSGGRTLRLAGTWVGANGAGFVFAMALVMCLILFCGWRRNCMAIILTAALVLTLSRQSIFTVLAGLLLVLIFHTMRARYRWQAVGAVALMVVVAMSVPFIRNRILASFDESDAGASARVDALLDFPGHMSGHWLFGLGWARPELTTGLASQTVNVVGNSPLLAIYRGGIFTGLAFIAVCIICCLVGYRALRSDSLPFALYGGVFIAYCLVSLQLDHGVIDQPHGALCFSFFLAFLAYIDRSIDERPRPAATAEKGRSRQLSQREPDAHVGPVT